MARLLTIKDFSRESYLASARAVTAAIIVGLLTLALVGRLAHLQVLKHQHFTTLSENNRVKIVPVAPTRGLIFDRNGEVLAQNLPAYGLEVVPELVEDVDALISELREIIEITDADEEEFLAVLARRPRFEKIPLRLRLDDQEVARFAVNRHRFPGVDIDARLTRNYPHGELGVHLVGYVGRIDKRELDSIDQADYRGTSHIGKTGIEASHEDWLHGKVGYQRVETNAQGRILRVLERHDPVPGSNLFLTMDVKLQRTAEAALGDERGAIVALEPLTGAVLAMASTPGFDPNLFVHGIDVDTYRSLQRSPERPLFNRAINGQYPPGSTIKPFLGLAGLEHSIGHAQGKSWCPGWFRLPGRERKYRDWKKHGHGRIGLRDAIVQSCDVYFYELALALGIDRMHEFLSSFGFGARTGIRLGGESPGLMPSRTWKRNARGQSWYPGETVITGIGAGLHADYPASARVRSRRHRHPGHPNASQDCGPCGGPREWRDRGGRAGDERDDFIVRCCQLETDRRGNGRSRARAEGHGQAHQRWHRLPDGGQDRGPRRSSASGRTRNMTPTSSTRGFTTMGSSSRSRRSRSRRLPLR